MSRVPYGEAFFQYHDRGTRKSAAVVVPVVLEYVQPKSIVDVGCGIGTWLAQFQAAGVEDVLGIDGDYVERRLLDIEPDRFLGHDLGQPVDVGRRFDLAACLEVAEHLRADRAEVLVASLVRLAPVVLFSAAIPYQQGNGHVNEQWPEYWRDRFAAHDYVVVDVLRDRLWHNNEIETWYRQNLMFFVERARLDDYPELRAHFERAGKSAHLSRVHPVHYEKLFEALSKNLSQVQRLWMRTALQLREINLLVFPDWSQPKAAVLDTLRRLFATVLAHPEHGRVCVVVSLGLEDQSQGSRLIGQAHYEVLTNNGMPLASAPHVSAVGGPRFRALEWEVLVGVTQARVVLPVEDVGTIAAVNAGELPTVTMEAIQRKQSFDVQPLTD